MSTAENLDLNRPEPAEQARYDAVVTGFARRFIYREPLVVDKAEAAMLEILRDPAINAIEDDQRNLEAVMALFRAIEAHEEANQIFFGSWQTQFLDLAAPEKLSRPQVNKLFDRFEWKELLIDQENTAREAYEEYYKMRQPIVLSPNITIQPEDAQVLLIDLKMRQAEREEDPAKRAKAVGGLQKELLDVIGSLPEEEIGKRFELKEIYLLRRLIENSGNGHLVSVSHATPREDLRKDFGSVDLQLAAAGDVIAYQLKTYKYGVARETRERQTEQLEHAEAQLRDTDTRLVRLEAERVDEAFEAAERNKKEIKLRDSFDALRPLTASIPGDQRPKLLTLLRVTEKDLEAERKKFEAREAERRSWEKELVGIKKKRIDEEAAIERAAEERELQRLAAIEMKAREAAEREARILAQQEADRLASEELRRRIAQEKEMNDAARAARRAAERAVLLQEQAKAQKKTRVAKEKPAETETAGWPPKSLEGHNKAADLVRLGLLAREQSAVFDRVKAAREKFHDLFGKKAPNAWYKKLFPSEDAFQHPSDDVLNQILSAVNK